MMNDWDFTEEILNDLYKTWPQMLYYTTLAFGLSSQFNYCLLTYLIKLSNDLFIMLYLQY